MAREHSESNHCADQRPWRVSLIGAFVSLFISPYSPGINYEVYPGSAFYLNQMLDRTAWSFVADHSSGLYHHPVGFNDLDAAQETIYSSHFTNRFAMVEGDMGSGSTTGDVANLQRMTALGLTPVAAFVNRPSTNLAVWRQLIRNNAAQGAPSYEMLAPHRLDDSPLGWYDPIRDYARDNMLVTGCIGSGVDAPVYLYVHEGADYRQTIYDLRDWSVANGRKFNYLLSPNNSYNAALLADTIFTVRDLEDQGHEPDVYGVVLYGERPVDLVPEKITVNGVDQAATTITGLAYWLIKHRDGEPGTLDLSALRNASSHGAGITSPILANASQSVVLPSSAPSTWSLRMENTSPWLDYAGVLRARVTGASSDWSFTFTSGTTDITSSVMSGDGRVFLSGERWLPGTTRTIAMTATPLTGSPGSVGLVIEALPHQGVDHALDVMHFNSGTIANTPPTLAISSNPRQTRENLPLGPIWFTCGDAETLSTALVVTASSSNPALVPSNQITLDQNGIQRWLRIVPAAGAWGDATITVTASDGSSSASRSFNIHVERTTILPVVKANNSIALDLDQSWQGSAIPGPTDQAVWDSTVTSANLVAATGALSFGGLRLADPGGDVTISGPGKLTLGIAGVDLSTSSRDLFLDLPVSLDESASWNVAGGRLIRVSSAIDGFGGLTKSGSGRLELLGNDSFAGPLGISAGELLKTGPGSQSSTTVSNNALLKVSHSGAFGLGGLSISAANNSTGRVEISGNISVLAGKAVSINARSSNTDAIQSLSGNNTFAGNVSLSTGGSTHAFSCQSGFLDLTGSISSIATGNRTLTLRGTADGRISGSVTDGSGVLGITKSGAGTWSLSGTHLFSGPVAVQEGVLEVASPLASQSLTVSPPAKLTGSALLGGPVNVAGEHSPGNGVGTQAITGSLTYLDTSQLVWELDGQSATGDLIEAASVTIANGARVAIKLNSPGSAVDFQNAFWRNSREWTILTCTNRVGNFMLDSNPVDPQARPSQPFGEFSLVHNPLSIVLRWTPAPPFQVWLYESFGDSWDDPSIAGSGADPDGDGWTNEAEWITGHHPADSQSRFSAVIDDHALTFTRLEGRSYRVETSTNPSAGWILHTLVPAGVGPIAIPLAPGSDPLRFYRVAVSSSP